MCGPDGCCALHNEARVITIFITGYPSDLSTFSNEIGQSKQYRHLYVIVLICAKLIINCLDDAWSMHGSRRSDSILGFYGAYL